MTTPKKKRTLEEMLSDPDVLRQQDNWLREVRKARTGKDFFNPEGEDKPRPPMPKLPPRKDT